LMGWYFSEMSDEMSSLKKDGGRAALDSTATTAWRLCESPRAGGVACGRQEGVALRLSLCFWNGFSSSGCVHLMDVARVHRLHGDLQEGCGCDDVVSRSFHKFCRFFVVWMKSSPHCFCGCLTSVGGGVVGLVLLIGQKLFRHFGLVSASAGRPRSWRVYVVRRFESGRKHFVCQVNLKLALLNEIPINCNTNSGRQSSSKQFFSPKQCVTFGCVNEGEGIDVGCWLLPDGVFRDFSFDGARFLVSMVGLVFEFVCFSSSGFIGFYLVLYSCICDCLVIELDVSVL